MAYKIDTDCLIGLIEKEVVRPILKYKCSKAFQIGRKQGREEGYKKGRDDGWKNKSLAYENEIEFLKTLLDKTGVPRWIPVEERLPELHTKVLCCGVKGGRFIAELDTWGYEKHLCWDKKNGRGCPEVTHWMPLPEPPKDN